MVAKKARRSRLPIPLLDMAAMYVFGDLASKLVEKLQLDEKIARAGIPVLPVQYAAKMIFLTVFAAFYSLAGAVTILTVVPHVTPLILLATIAGAIAIPVTVFAYHLATLSSAESNRMECIEPELPLFAAYMSVLVRSGLSPEDVLLRIASNKSLPCASKEARRMLTIRYQKGYDVLTCMEIIARYHPNKAFKEFIEGFILSLRTFASPIEYLSEATKQMIARFEQRIKTVANKTSVMATMLVMVTILVLFINMLSMLGTVGRMNNPLLSMLLPPILTGVMILMIDKSVPRLPRYMKDVWGVFGASIPAGILAALVFSNFAAPYIPSSLTFSWELGITLAVPSLIASMWYRRIAREESGIVTNFAAFLRDLASGRRRGLPLEHVILTVRGYGTLDKILNVLKKNIALGYRIGMAIRAAFARVRTTTVRLLAELLADVIVLGGATPEALTTMETFVTKIIEAMEELKIELRSYRMIPYIIVFLNAFILVLVSGYMVQFASGFGTGIMSSSPIHVSQQQFESTIEYTMIGLVVVGWLSGIMVGILSDLEAAAGLKHAALMTILVPLLATLGLMMTTRLHLGLFH